MLPDFFRKYTNILSIHIYYIFTIYSYILYRNNNQDLYASMINNHRAFYGGGALSLLCICPLSLVTDISAMVASCFAALSLLCICPLSLVTDISAMWGTKFAVYLSALAGY